MKNSLRLFLIVFFSFFISFSFVAQTQGASTVEVSPRFLTRGEIISKVIQGFDLVKKEQDFLNDCQAHLDECFFVFSARSQFHKLTLKPVLLLYPDVQPGYRYYDAINTATILDLVQGYPQEKESPFHPRGYMSRIEALKVIMGAGQLLKWKERFEIASELGDEMKIKKQQTAFLDIKAELDHMWWYPRYVNFALQKNIIEKDMYFRPDESITAGEFEEMLSRSLKTSF